MTIAGNRRVEVRFFGGVVTAGQLEELADIAAERSEGILMATADQDIALHIAEAFDPEDAASTLQAAGFELEGTTFRICPGSHLCRVGLSPTRDVARAIIDSMGPSARALDLGAFGLSQLLHPAATGRCRDCQLQPGQGRGWRAHTPF